MAKVLVTGAGGLLGSALRRVSPRFPGHEFVFVERSAAGGDLTEAACVRALFETHQPAAVIHTAAAVGGIRKNRDEPEHLFHANVLLNAQVIHHAALAGVKKLVAFGSTCAFAPELATLSAAHLHEGMPFANNAAYGYAKRMIEVHLAAAQQQYGMKYCYLVPPSMYGPNDHFSLSNGHVIAALIRKCALARAEGKDFIRVWGDGSPLREVIYSEDVAVIALDCLDRAEGTLVLSTGQEVSVRAMAEAICARMGVRDILWETDQPNGQPRRAQGPPYPFPFTPFVEGIRRTCDWYASNHAQVRT